MARGAVAGAFVALATCGAACTLTPADAGVDAGVPVQTCGQACVDSRTGVAVVDLANDLFNQSLAGKNAGSQSEIAPCPLGGSAMITGTTAVDTTHDITSVNLTLAFAACQLNTNGSHLTLDGTLTEVGTFDQSNRESINFAGDAVTIAGNVSGTGVDDTSCATHVNYDSLSSPQVTGTICGRAF